MEILLTNDDGLKAPGLRALGAQLNKLGRVTVVAPSEEQSGTSHSITLFNPVAVIDKSHRRRTGHIYAVSGTPTDCVKLALCRILKRRPDVVVSGINLGANVGVDIFYSGTVAAVMEASLWGITAFAVSIERSPAWGGSGASPQGRLGRSKGRPDFHRFSRLAFSLIKSILANRPARGSVFNINIPARPGRIKGVKFTHQDITLIKDDFMKGIDPRGQHYYWMKSGPAWTGKKKSGRSSRPGDLSSDTRALKSDYISITPLRPNLTDYQILAHPPKVGKI